MAKDYIAKATAPVTTWTGPTTGPKAQGKKLVIYVSADQRNGGAQRRRRRRRRKRPRRSAGTSASSTGRARSRRAPSALDPGDRAEAGRHHPRHDRRRASRRRSSSRRSRRASRSSAGMPGRGPARSRPCRASSPTSPPTRSRSPRPPGLYAVVDSTAPPGVIIFTNSIYAIATAKTNAEKAAIEGLQGLQGAGDRGHADRRPLQPHGAAHHLAARQIRQGLDLFDRR